MPTEFVTLLRSEVKCRDCLLGQSIPHGQEPSERFALPVKSFAVGSPQERITFQLVKADEIGRPSMWKVLFWALRLPLLTLSWTPVVAVWVWLWAGGYEFKAQDLFLVLGNLFLLHMGVFLLNDYWDHMRGVDRLSSRRGSQVIQRGWLRAWQVRLWGWAALVTGGLLGTGILLWSRASLELWVLVFGAAFAVLILAWSPRKLRRWALTELLILLSLGPLLTCGSMMFWLGSCSPEIGALGLGFGVLALLSFHLRSLGALLSEKSLLGRLGFDLSHRLLSVEIALLPVFFAFVFWALGEFRLGLVLGALVLFVGLKLLQLLVQSRSSLSSSLRPLRAWALLMHFSVGVGVALVALM